MLICRKHVYHTFCFVFFWSINNMCQYLWQWSRAISSAKHNLTIIFPWLHWVDLLHIEFIFIWFYCKQNLNTKANPYCFNIKSSFGKNWSKFYFQYNSKIGSFFGYITCYCNLSSNTTYWFYLTPAEFQVYGNFLNF